jgi:hypothetical protein
MLIRHYSTKFVVRSVPSRNACSLSKPEIGEGKSENEIAALPPGQFSHFRFSLFHFPISSEVKP